MYRFKSNSIKIVFLVYPHVMAELQQRDRINQHPVLDAVHVVTLMQQSPLSMKHYHDFFLCMLRDEVHGELVASLFLQKILNNNQTNTGECFPDLAQYGFKDYSPAKLHEYATLLAKFLLTDSGDYFKDRLMYNAAVITLFSTYLPHEKLLTFGDAQFVVQHVRPAGAGQNTIPMLTLEPSSCRLLMQRVLEDVINGCLPEMVQHPCLYDRYNFLQQFDAYCREERQLEQLLDAVDQRHGLPLLYWSVWGPSSCLFEWCLLVTCEQDTSKLKFNVVLSTAFAMAIVSKVKTKGEFCNYEVLITSMIKTNQCQTAFKETQLPTISKNQRYSEQLQTVWHDMETQIHQTSNVFLKLELSEEMIFIGFPFPLHPYVALRLLKDRQKNQQDDDGNTILHLAAKAGMLKIIEMAVAREASLTLKNKAGKTPPELAAEWRQTRSARPVDHVWSDFSRACAEGNVNLVKTFLCYILGVNDRNEDGWTPLHFAASQRDVVSLTDTGHDLRETKVEEINILGKTQIKTKIQIQIQIVQLLLNLHADVNAKSQDGDTALHLACTNGYAHVVELLLHNGADINATDNSNKTSLHLASAQGHVDVVKLLLKQQADVNNYTTVNGRTPLLEACARGNTEIVQLLLQGGTDINCTDEDGQTPLYLASRSGNSDTVEVLLQRQADVNSTNKLCETPLCTAIARGNVEIAQLLLKHQASVNISMHKNGQTPLHESCAQGKVDCVKLLLDHQADVNATDMNDQTPLHVASARGNANTVQGSSEELPKLEPHTEICVSESGNADVVQLLLQRQAIVNIADQMQRTPLHIACTKSNVDIVRILLEHKADVNVTDKIHQTPLHVACSQGVADFVELLLQHQASANVSDVLGRTPLHAACTQSNAKIVQLLLQHQADVNIADSEKKTPLFFACTVSNADIVQHLLQHQATVNTADRMGRTPLYFACLRGKADIIKPLLESSADVDITDSDNQTPLHLAAARGSENVVCLLMQYGADTRIKNSKGLTALKIAQQNNHENVVNMIKNRKPKP
jgi:ankyrin repeat protein